MSCGYRRTRVDSRRWRKDFLKTLLYVVGQTAGWFACVLGAAHNKHWLGVFVVMGLLVMHVVTKGNRSVGRIMVVVLVSIVFGFCFDSLLIFAGVYEPVRWLVPSPFAAIWLVTLWVNFALIIDVPLQWLQQHLVVAAVFGGLFGPAAYLGGRRLEAIQIAEPTGLNIAALAVAWAFGLAVLMLLARLLPAFASQQKTPTGSQGKSQPERLSKR
jgi:Protein of unknown function (DUF2878)